MAAPSQWDAHLIELEQHALDDAFRAHVQLLYSNWLKDYHHHGASQRVRNGAANARAAYVQVMQQIEARRN